MRRLVLGTIAVDLEAGLVERAEGQARLGGRELELLRALARSPGEIVPRSALLAEVWGIDDPLSRALDVALGRLRRKVELDPAHPRYVLSIHGEGVRLELGAAAAAAPPAPPAAGRFGPAEGPPLLGREREEGLVEEWGAGSGRWLTLVGPGGVGKTRLLQAALARLGPAFSGGAAWVDLSSVEDPAAILPSLAAALGLDLQRRPEPAVQIARAVADAPMLWALDNLEHLAPHLEPLVRLAERCPGVRVIASSRVRIEHLAEATLRLPGLDPDAALALFSDRAQRVRPAWQPNREEQALIQRIHEAVGGLPLGLELAAAALRSLDLPALRARLVDVHDPSRPLRHRSLRSMFAASWALLDGEARGALARLSVFRAPISEEAAEAVAGAAPEVLDRLVDASLARRAGEELELHPLIRQLAAERLAEIDPAGRSQDRLRAWALDWLRRAAAPLRGPSPGELLREIGRRDADLRAAVASCDAADGPALLAAGPALFRVLTRRKHAVLWDQTLAGLAERLRRRGEPRVAAAVDVIRSPVRIDLSSISDLAALIEGEPGPALPEAYERFRWLNRVAALVISNRPAEALAAIDAAQARPASGEDPSGWAELEARRCRALALSARLAEGEAAGLRAIQRARQARDALVEADATRVLAMLHIDAHDFAAAFQRYTEALALYEPLEDPEGIGSSAHGLAIVYKAWGDLARAEGCARQAVERAFRGSRDRGAWIHTLGNILWRQGRYAEAQACLAEAVRIAADQDYAFLERDAWDALANVAYVQGRLEEAVQLGARSLAIAERLGNPNPLARAQSNQAMRYLAAGQLDQAERLGRLAIENAGASPYLQAVTRVILAQAAIQAGRPGEALADLRWAGEWGAAQRHEIALNYSLKILAWALAALGEIEPAILAFGASRPVIDMARQDEAIRAALAGAPGLEERLAAAGERDLFAAWAALRAAGALGP